MDGPLALFLSPFDVNRPRTWIPRLALVLSLSCVLARTSPAPGAPGTTSYRFDFGSGSAPAAPGWIKVTPATSYTHELGYGFEGATKVVAVDRGGDDPLRGDYCTSDQPFFFSVDLPEGNYDVTVTLGDREGDSTTTV